MSRQECVHTAQACGLAGEVVRAFGEVRLRVFGTSMVPSILPGDLISVQRAGVLEVSCGDIVLYARMGRLFVHRVVGCTGNRVEVCKDQGESLLITRGDRLKHNDLPISAGELLGRVISIARSFNGEEIPLKPAATLRGWQRVIAGLLRYSDQATYAYVRVARFGIRVMRFASHMRRARFTVNVHRERRGVPLQAHRASEFQQSARGAECQG